MTVPREAVTPPRVRILGPEPSIRGDDGRWRAWVELEDGQVGVQLITAEEAMQGSAAWATKPEEMAALADLMRRR